MSKFNLFGTIQAAQDYAALFAGATPGATRFESAPDIRVGPVALITAENQTEFDELNRRAAEQQGFCFRNAQGDLIRIVIGPFRNGFLLWFVNSDSGAAIRA
ncbi:MAG: hypothetical protein A3B30_00100 [Candidatus Komeilibacteria bacterium RIFCSPLOWO2_01_FULL_52_15]|uniref:Uncharacterized protein n=2 Tax=Candidatus Komeiliibacteriota TaxID=1817908 RepID=A0A1G2BN74_9BACT|nr:MAG: hypothetical protein A2677_00175 [Candidatus Komeilibacteria bacterium RIFCSPHIGHO2_01_FULL_52_14]OGY90602.1 MAG: hypothetical protein A3B30_00100 [Candidatus Komeilibacteria bacterium RIFCSPLOWO2_01_FULL_52_15]